MSSPAGCQLIGKWQIVGADLWDRDYLDMVEPAYLTIAKNGRGEFAFGCVNATMEVEYANTIVFFRWDGFDERMKSPAPRRPNSTTTDPSKSSSPSTTATTPY
jgi:hypothetical protein